jgi:hypothetical protein
VDFIWRDRWGPVATAQLTIPFPEKPSVTGRVWIMKYRNPPRKPENADNGILESDRTFSEFRDCARPWSWYPNQPLTVSDSSSTVEICDY